MAGAVKTPAKSPKGHLKTVTDAKSARRVHQTLSGWPEAALSEPRRRERREVLGALEERYPELKASPPAGNAAANPSRSPDDSGRSTRGTGKTRRPAAPRVGRAPKPARQVARAATGHAKPLSQTVITVLGATVAFSVLYALLTNAEASGSGSVIARASGGFTRFLRLFVDPTVDPLNPSTAKASSKTTSTTTTGAAPASSSGTSSGPARTPLPTLPSVDSGPLFSPSTTTTP